MKQSIQDVKVLLLDIEGTVCPISFVKDTLFPYALKALPGVLETKWTDPDFQPYKLAFPESAQQSREAFMSHVHDLTTRDVKVAYLKNLQGYLWEEGYKSSAYSTPLFSDITRIFNPPTHAPANPHEELNHNTTTTVKKRPIAIYSSGSIFAQKLLFAHSQWPTASSGTHAPTSVVDLTPQIAAYFDTTTAGAKTQSTSYTAVVGALKQDQVSLVAEEILFLSDNVLEVRAALDAGLKAVVVDRPGNVPLTAVDREAFDVVTSFDQLDL